MGRPRVTDPVKDCATCGIRLQRKTYNGRLEDMGAFRRRKFCSLQCSSASFAKDVLSNSKSYCKRARPFLGTSCEACGVTTRLQAHHIDSNRRNNSPENIQTLCISCHVSHHHRARRAGLTVAGKWTSPASPPVAPTA
jgi:5-methylcytosine-specific restriction endonuclease McrA